ncbi:MAG: TonB-dependent receptor [Epsilonproteobacteria bacterium]|nr:TonB-dependent receptor [Campylobacterota bacterium]
MKRVVISIVTATVVVSASTNVKLDTIMVTTATKTSKNIEGVSASVIVVDAQKIESMGASTLGDVIKKTPGLTVQYGTFPSASSKSKSSISLRGMGANGTLFLINGKRLSGEVKNPYDLDRIPASAIERVEVVKGPMSSLYGADAVGGVINIIMKKPTKVFEGSVGAKYGSNIDGDGSNSGLNFNVRGKKEKLSYSFNADALYSEPYTQSENANVLVKTATGKVKPSVHPYPGVQQLADEYVTDVTYREKATVYNFGGRLSYDFNDVFTMGVDANYMDEEREGAYNGYYHPSNHISNGNKIPIFNIPVNSIDENSRRNIGVDTQWTVSNDLLLKLNIYNSFYKKRNTTTAVNYQAMGYENEVASSANGMSADVDITSYELSGNHVLSDTHLLTFGGEHRDETREATVFDNTPGFSEKSVDYQALYLQDEWELSDTLNVVFGGRYDAISNADNKATFRVGAVKNLSKALNFRFNFAQGYRTPDIREMYIFKQTPAGMQRGAETIGYNLQPEFTNAYEVGLSGTREGFDYAIALFYNQIDDQIEQVQRGDTDTGQYWTFENVSEAETFGVETTLGYSFDNGAYLSFAWNELQTENKDTGKDLEFNPERTLSMGLDTTLMADWSVGILATYIGEQYYSKATTNGNIDASTEAYTLVDLTSSYKFGDNKKYEIYGGVNNIFDESVENILGSNVGTYVFAGIRADF